MKREIGIFLDMLNLWEDANKKLEVVNFFSYLIEQGGKDKIFPTNILPNFVKEVPQMKAHQLPAREYMRFSDHIGKPLPDPKSFQFAFLPEKQEVTPLEHMEFIQNNYLSVYCFPWFLCNWLEGKKVCVIEKAHLLHPSKEDSFERNYLEYLPYNSFLLEIETPISLKTLESSLLAQIDYKHFMVHKEGSSISVMAIPSHCTELTYTEANSSILDKTISSMHGILESFRKLKSEVRNPSKSTHIKAKHFVKSIEDLQKSMEKVEEDETEEFAQGFTLPCVIKFDTTYFGSDYTGVDILSSENISEDERANFTRHLFFILNEFCRLLSTPNEQGVTQTLPISTTTPPEDSTSGSQSVADQTEETYEWFEVPFRQIDIFKLRKTSGVLSGSLTRGGEKAPHPRRKHQRTYKNKEGISITIDVKESYVHKEKVQQGEAPKSGTLKA